MVYELDEADLLFGDGRKELPEDETELIFAMQSEGLSLDEKLRAQDKFRTERYVVRARRSGRARSGATLDRSVDGH